MTRHPSITRFALGAALVATLALLCEPASAPAAAGMEDVIVVLKRQIAPPSSGSASRAERVRALLKALRDNADADQRGLLALLVRRRAEGRVALIRPYWIFNGARIVADPDVIAEIAARPEVAQVRPNATVAAPPAPSAAAAAAEPNVALVNAPALWDLGRRGQGVVVANLDTGVDLGHPELAARWRGGTNSWYDPNGEHPSTPTDVSGHGTWTMGVMVGGDAGGTALGIAPDARWIAAKIFDDHGSTTTARIHSAFQWLLDPDGNPATADAPNVVNNSWTLSSPGCNLAFQLDLRALRAAGILPVFAAGNAGPASATSMSPANNPEAFAVGSTGLDDAIDPSSSRGPSACGTAPYPRLVAPGINIRTADLFSGYTSQSGTSLAAPHVAGALALLLGAFPGASVERQEGALESGAVDLGPPGPDDIFGRGRLDALAAYRWLASAPDFTLSASPASVTAAAGTSAAFTVNVAGVNGFADDVALTLSGLTGAQASWSFTPPAIAGGSGSAQLTVTTAATLSPGTYPLTIRGTSGTASRSVGVSLVVPAPPDFTLAATPAQRTTLAGGSVAYTVSVGTRGGFAGDVALSLSGLTAAQAGWTFAPATVTGASGTSQLTVTTAASLPAGSYPLTITGVSGSLTHTAAVTLVVSPAPDFVLGVAPASATVVAGQSTAYTVTVSSLAGFAGTVSLSLSGLPSGASSSYAPASVAAPGTSTLTIRATRQTTRGTFNVKVTGKSGALVRQVPATLVVRSG